MFLELWVVVGANKTSLCPRCGPWATDLQLLLKYSFWNNSVFVVWFISFIYGPVTSEPVFPTLFLEMSLATSPSSRALHGCVPPACSRFRFPTPLPLSCLLRLSDGPSLLRGAGWHLASFLLPALLTNCILTKPSPCLIVSLSKYFLMCRLLSLSATTLIWSFSWFWNQYG